MRRVSIYLSLLTLLLMLAACQDEPTQAPPPDPAKPATATRDLMNVPLTVERFETTAEALTVWRRYREQRPCLLLLSNNPHLNRVPEELRKPVDILINNARPGTLAMATTDRNPSPLLLPGMAADAALRSGWFRELAWALPLRDAGQMLDLEKFRAQLLAAEIAEPTETASLQLTDRSFAGTLRHTPFRAAALPLLQGLSQPVIVHIDLSYFQPLYQNELATPVFDLLLETLVTLKKMHLQTLAVTLSYGHLDSRMALDVRYLGDVVTYLIEDPARLDQPIPINWQRQRDALYQTQFAKSDAVEALFRAQEQDAPNAAWVRFNLYRLAHERGDTATALERLAEAVARNRIYALEYLDLSARERERGHTGEALRMLELAALAFPHDPFIKLQIAQLANDQGDQIRALEELNSLRNLEWSTIYYPQIPRDLANLTTYVQTGKRPAQGAPAAESAPEREGPPTPTPAGQTGQRALHPR